MEIYCAKCDLVYDNTKRSASHLGHPDLVGTKRWFARKILAFVTRNW